MDNEPSERLDGDLPEQPDLHKKPGLAVLMNPSDQRILSAEKLQLPDKTTSGDTIATSIGRGVLTQLSDVEGQEWFCPVGLIGANPDQPREYFDEVSLRKLADTIASEGQQTAIEVVPYLDSESSEMRFVIIDGERRFRAITQYLKSPYIRVIVRWEFSVRKIFARAFITNLSRQNHNAIEEAKAVKKLIGYEQEDGDDDPITTVSTKTGVSTERIKNLLYLLEITDPFPEIQTLIMEGKMDTTAALALPVAVRRYGKKLGMMRLTRVLLDGLDKRREDPSVILSGPARITARDVKASVRRVLIEGSGAEDVIRLDLQRAIVKVPAHATALIRFAARLATGDQDVVDEFLRSKGRGEPVEIMRDQVADVIAVLERLQPVLNRAIRPPPLDIPPGLPKFAAFVASKGNEKFSDNELRFRIARMIAEASDRNQGDMILASELATALSVDVQTVVGNLRELQHSLESMGLVLEMHTVRVQNRRARYEQRTAYRFAWSIEVKDKAHRQKKTVTLPDDRGGVTALDIVLVTGRSSKEVVAVLKNVRGLLESLGLVIPTTEKGTGEKPSDSHYRKVEGFRLSWSDAAKAEAVRRAAAAEAAADIEASRGVEKSLQDDLDRAERRKRAAAEESAQIDPSQPDVVFEQASLKTAGEAVESDIVRILKTTPEINLIPRLGDQLVVEVQYRGNGRFAIASNIQAFSVTCGGMQSTFARSIGKALGIKRRQMPSISVHLVDITE